jgi:hypothetical protein
VTFAKNIAGKNLCVFMGECKCILACSIKPYDMQKVKNVLMKPVQFVGECTIVLCVCVCVCICVTVVKISRMHPTHLIDDFQLQNCSAIVTEYIF